MPGIRHDDLQWGEARRFYLRQGALLALAAIALAGVFHATRLDLRLEAPWYDAVNRTFPWRYAWVTKYLIHRHLKVVLILIGLMTWIVALRASFGRPRAALAARRRRWWVVALSFAVIPVASALLRRSSTMHCPWDVDAFGGYAPYVDLLGTIPAGMRPGHCFPAGFVTGSSWLLAFGLLYYPERPRRSALLGGALLLFALGMGWVQQMRGAHFLSHTLWALWLSWLLVLLLHAACGAWREWPPRTP